MGSRNGLAGVRVLGVAASPHQGATEVLVQAAMLGVQSLGATAEYVSLAGSTIAPCNGCGDCLDAGRCLITDDMTLMYPRLLAADAILIGTSVYFGMPSGLCKAFLERVQGFGVDEKRLRFKVGGAIAVAASDHGGQESTMAALHLWFQINEMLPVGITTPNAGWGVGGRATEGEDILAQTMRATGADLEVPTVKAAWLYGRKVALTAAVVQAGLEVTGLDTLNRPYGTDLDEASPPELASLAIGAVHVALD
jgi:multimeric flavodoxin WrbA